MTKASADADKFGATERRVHKGRRLISSSRAEFPTETSPVSAWVEITWGSVISFLFGFDDMLIPRFLVIALPLICPCIRPARIIAPRAKHESVGKSRLVHQYRDH